MPELMQFAIISQLMPIERKNSKPASKYLAQSEGKTCELIYWGVTAEKVAAKPGDMIRTIIEKKVSNLSGAHAFKRFEVQHIKGQGPALWEKVDIKPKENITLENFDLESAADNLRDKILNALLKNSESMDYIPEEGTFRASSAHGCARATILTKLQHTFSEEQRKQIQQREDEFLRFKKRLGPAEAGNGLHERIQRIIPNWDHYESHEGEVKFVPEGYEFEFVGHYDLLINNPGIPGVSSKIVIDLKGANPKWWDRFEWVHKPKYFDQLMIYQHGLGGIDGGILYVNRDDYTLKLLLQKYDAAHFKSVCDNFANLRSHEKNGTLPPRLDPTDFPCQKTNKYGVVSYTCKFFDICFLQEGRS